MARDSLGSILGPLSVNMYLADFVLARDDTDIVNCADDNTPYVTEDDLDGVIASLMNASNTLLNGLVKIFVKEMPINVIY